MQICPRSHQRKSRPSNLATPVDDECKIPHEIFSGAILDDETGKYLEFCHLIKLDKYRFIWMKSFSNELGRLTQGIHEISGTNTIDFIPYS